MPVSVSIDGGDPWHCVFHVSCCSPQRVGSHSLLESLSHAVSLSLIQVEERNHLAHQCQARPLPAPLCYLLQISLCFEYLSTDRSRMESRERGGLKAWNWIAQLHYSSSGRCAINNGFSTAF